MWILQGLRWKKTTIYVCITHNFWNKSNLSCVRHRINKPLQGSACPSSPTLHLVSSHEPSLCSVLWASWWIISNQIIDKVHAEQRDKEAKVTPGDLIELWEIKYKLRTVTIYNYKWTIIRGTRNTTRHLLLEVGWLIDADSHENKLLCVFKYQRY